MSFCTFELTIAYPVWKLNRKTTKVTTSAHTHHAIGFPSCSSARSCEVEVTTVVIGDLPISYSGGALCLRPPNAFRCCSVALQQRRSLAPRDRHRASSG